VSRNCRQGRRTSGFCPENLAARLDHAHKRNDRKFPEGYIGALLKFGRNFAAHGSEEMPVWGAQFQSLDPARDPTGQQHIDDVVAYIRSLQVK
jgi:hypothetical protein